MTKGMAAKTDDSFPQGTRGLRRMGELAFIAVRDGFLAFRNHDPSKAASARAASNAFANAQQDMDDGTRFSNVLAQKPHPDRHWMDELDNVQRCGMDLAGMASEGAAIEPSRSLAILDEMFGKLGAFMTAYLVSLNHELPMEVRAVRQLHDDMAALRADLASESMAAARRDPRSLAEMMRSLAAGEHLHQTAGHMQAAADRRASVIVAV